MSRRCRGGELRLAAALAAVLLATMPAAPRAQAPPARMTRAWPVMGTMFVATAWGRDTAVLLRAVHAAHDSVRLVDSLMSNYRPGSDVSRLNAGAGAAAQRVSSQTLHVLLQARRFWRLSGGLFDPTVGPFVRAWGFYGDSGRVPTRAEIDSLRPLVGYGRVELDSAGGTVRLPIPGMSLDLGGIAKGYALDLARAALRDPAISGGMLDLGGNLLVFGRPPRGSRWIVGIRDARRDGRIIGTVAIDSGAVATSGDYEHYFRIGGVRYGHLIDPTTGFPRRGVLSATAVGPTGEWSDGLSGALFLAGATRGAAIADSLHGTAGIWLVDRARAAVRP
ncbi:MAG TPA: FAD:protein FMN transferase, partial [Gemmatimonadaceae bacterium]|nr:FAD:protein FMN transferase [Gemmatimonadaceae bacterium]